ncbi:MULE transposase domain-containing protein [Pleurotus pulmonarius]
MDYETFSRPPSTQRYSSEYFKSLTFAHAANLDYPPILPPDSIPSWVWHTDVPGSASANLILPSDVVPHLVDLQPILRAMPEAFSSGSRSVILKLVVNGEEKNVHYHFSKLNLFRLINNNEKTVTSARRLIQELSSSLPVASLVWFQQQRVSDPLCGLFGASFPLWKLGCLLDENWLEEDVLNAIAEITYFSEAARNPIPTNIPSFLYLPTSFFTDTYSLFSQPNRLYSAELLNLRKRLEQTVVSFIGFIVWQADHFAAYYTAGAGQLYHGDSLSLPPHTGLLAMLDWVFDGLWTEFESPKKIIPGSIGQQGFGNGGDGSCGVAAHNFIESSVDATVPRWHGNRSGEFRGGMLLDLVNYHRIASAASESLVSEDHWFPCVDLSGYRDVNGFTGYRDFNMYAPKPSHPIYRFLAEKQPGLSIFTPSLPLVEKLDTAPPGRISPQIPSGVSSPLLSPFIPTQQGEMKRSPSLEIVTNFHLTRPRNRGVKREPSLEIISPKSSRNIKPRVRSPSITIISPPKWGQSEKCRSLKHEAPEVCAVGPGKQEPVGFGLGLREISVASGVIRLGLTFNSLEEAQQIVFQSEADLGHIWRVGQSKSDHAGKKKKVTFRCRRYQQPGQSHSSHIDPSDCRTGNSIRTNCSAHVNVNRVGKTSIWHITTVDLQHNHDRELPEGGHVRRPATKNQKQLISQLSVGPIRYSHSQVMNICNTQFPEHTLEPRQISSLITAARKEAKNEVAGHGGDMAAILAILEEKAELEGYKYKIKLDENQKVTGLWWQSGVMSELLVRFSDILINDNTANRNDCGYALDIGIIVDNFGKSRNIWYAVMEQENIDHHSWVLRCHIEAAIRPPEVFASDRDPALITAVANVMPLTFHLYCLHHLNGNVSQAIRASIGPEWTRFNNMFWEAYRAVSPEEFDRLWNILIDEFPSAASYLQRELYTCREHWAHAWVSSQFVAGIRTNGRCEVENRINKSFLGPKVSLKQLFDYLNDRSKGQTVQDMVRVRDSSRRQHDNPIERVFPGPLKQLRAYVGPFALHTSFKEMSASVYYQISTLLLPDGVRTWSEYAFHVTREVGFNWVDHEEMSGAMNMFQNDNAYISTQFLLRLITGLTALTPALLPPALLPTVLLP